MAMTTDLTGVPPVGEAVPDNRAQGATRRHPRMTRRLPAACLAVLSFAVVAACGGTDSSSTPPSVAGSDGSATTCSAAVTVANLPVGSAAAVVLGVEKGLFTEEGLEVTLKDTAAPALQASVVSGDAQFAFTSVPAVLATASNGLPVQVVAPASALPNAGEPSNIVTVAKADSGITTAADLAGKRIAVDALYQLPHITLIRAARAAGVDPSTFKVSEVPYPAMMEAVERGQVDAADISDTFLLQALDEGYVEVLPNNEGATPGAVAAIWISSEAYVKDNTEVVGCFQRGVAASNAYAVEHSDEVRTILPTFTKIPEDQIEALRLPNFDVKLDKVPFQNYQEVMKENGVVKKDVDLDSLIVPSAS